MGIIVGLFIFLLLVIGFCYHLLIDQTKYRLSHKVSRLEMFIDKIKIYFMDAEELTFLGTQGKNSVFFQLKFGKGDKEIYRIKKDSDIIRFDRVIYSAWYRQTYIQDHHVGKIASIDLRGKNDLVNRIDFGSIINSKVRRYKAEIDLMEDNIEKLINKFTKLTVQHRKSSRGLSVTNPISNEDVLNFVKRNFK